MTIRRTGESSPLWVWLAVALLALGALAYVAVVSVMEYLMAATGLVSRLAEGGNYIASASAGRVCRSSRAQTRPSTTITAALASRVGCLPTLRMPNP
jgi:hypothetical protein